MKFQKTPLALAASALLASAPFTAHALSGAFVQPTSEQTVSGVLQGSACEVRGSGISWVRFYWDYDLVSTDKAGPFQCSIDTTKYPNGRHRVRAVYYDSAGANNATSVYVNVQNGTTTPTTNTPPTLSISAPASGATVKGTVACSASASDSNGVQNVAFSLDGAPLSTDSTSPYACSFDSTKLANGTHKLTAVASDGLGATTTREVSFTVDNTVATNPGPTITWTAPANGAKLSNQAACATTVSDSNGVAKVDYFLNDKLWRTEKVAPYTCEFWTKNYADGAYVLKAVATDTKGATSTAQINVTIANNATTPPADTTPPTVSITSPASGAKVVPNTPYTADAKDNTAVAKVEVFIAAGTTQKLVDTKTAAPYSGTLNTTGLPNGTATLMAVATDTAGLSSTTQRSVTIDNTASNPDPDPTDPGPGTGSGTTLPANGARAVPTFESLGMYWKPGSNPGADGCSVRYRKADETAWK